MNNWYPKKLAVLPEGTPETYNFMQNIFNPQEHFSYAEFGFYQGDTAKNVCRLFPNSTLHLFDFHENCRLVKDKLSEFSNQIYFYGNTEKYLDSYNWSLMKLLETNRKPIFDYCFLDGAHTFAVDALNFYLCDKLTKVGGYLDFDDYSWTLRDSSLDPQLVPAIGEQYTDEQIDSYQVAKIVDLLVEQDERYVTVVPKKIYQKVK